MTDLSHLTDYMDTEGHRQSVPSCSYPLLLSRQKFELRTTAFETRVPGGRGWVLRRRDQLPRPFTSETSQLEGSESVYLAGY